MADLTPPLTSLHLWHVTAPRVPAALGRMATDRSRLRDTPGVRFAKLLGTGDGRTFDVRDADVRTWGLLAVWEEPAALGDFERASAVAAGWARLADQVWRADLVPLASRGRWSGIEPFAARPVAPGRWRPPPQATASRWRGPVAAVTRARLHPLRMHRFWAAVPPIIGDLDCAAGLRLRVGIGEAPVGLQGTFSVWETAAALQRFAYRTPAHAAAIRRTPDEGWYVEELFARFAVLQITGRILHRAPTGPPADTSGPVRPRRAS